MASPTAAPPVELPKRRFKMQLINDEFMVDVAGNNGRYPAGAVLLADEETALRWYERGVAEIADPDAEVYGEIVKRNKREEFMRRAVPAAGVFDQAVTRQSFRDDPDTRPIMPPAMPTRGRRRRADLEGAEVVTDPMDDDE